MPVPTACAKPISSKATLPPCCFTQKPRNQACSYTSYLSWLWHYHAVIKNVSVTHHAGALHTATFQAVSARHVQPYTQACMHACIEALRVLSGLRSRRRRCPAATPARASSFVFLLLPFSSSSGGRARRVDGSQRDALGTHGGLLSRRMRRKKGLPRGNLSWRAFLPLTSVTVHACGRGKRIKKIDSCRASIFSDGFIYIYTYSTDNEWCNKVRERARLVAHASLQVLHCTRTYIYVLYVQHVHQT